jgi:type VI secretion system (T6SS) VasI/EvfG family protein
MSPVHETSLAARSFRLGPLAAALGSLAAPCAPADGDLSSKVKACATIAGAPDRLACFDALAGKEPPAPATVVAAHWEIRESKSAVDSSPETTGLNALSPAQSTGLDPAALVLRCRDHKTEFFIAANDPWGGSADSLRVFYRTDDGVAVERDWLSSPSGKAAFAPGDAIAFAQSLPESGKLFIRVFDAIGEKHEATFQLDGIAEVRRRVAAACDWPAPPAK